MNFEKALEELQTLKDVRPEICKKIKNHNLPVIVFGAGVTAKHVTEVLKSHGVEVSGYARDGEYYKPNKTYLGRPVYNFDELATTPEKYIFILAITDDGSNSRAYKFMKDNRIIKYAFSYEFNSKNLNYEYISANREKFSETFYWLADEFSKQTMIEFLKLKITHDLAYNFETYRPDQYFNEITNGVLTPNWGGGYVDCGAFNGDTVEGFINWSGGNYEKIFAVEADPMNFAALEKFIQEKNYQNVVAINCGVWNEKTTLNFSDTNNFGSSVSEDGKIKINADTVDNITGGEKISFIKMDVEGAELPALQGAVETIKKYAPTLAICAYHKTEDLITLPQFIKNLNLDYKFYLRKYALASDTELVLYAIP